MTFHRREFLKTAALTGLAVRSVATAAEAERPALVDTNVTLGRWPFRRLPLDETPALLAKLRANGVTQAWAGSFEALLHKDLSAVNARLAEECRARGEGVLVPTGASNPTLPDWEADLRRCVEEHRMRGLRLYPNYHGYTLADPLAERLLTLAAERGLLVQIVVGMEDERTLHPLVNVPATDTAPLAGLMSRVPGLRVQLLNAFRTVRGKPLAGLAAAGVRFEIATLEGVAGIARVLGEIEADRLLFGSHAPFFYFESALLKLKESALSEGPLRALSFANAAMLLPSSR